MTKTEEEFEVLEEEEVLSVSIPDKLVPVEVELHGPHSHSLISCYQSLR